DEELCEIGDSEPPHRPEAKRLNGAAPQPLRLDSGRHDVAEHAVLGRAHASELNLADNGDGKVGSGKQAALEVPENLKVATKLVRASEREDRDATVRVHNVVVQRRRVDASVGIKAANQLVVDKPVH